MKLIIVGAGGATREVLRRLGDTVEPTVIDPSKERLDLARGIRALRAVPGDGTSRLVLERAGLAETDALLAATHDDDANLEICRTALERGVHRVVAVAADPERLPEYRALGVPAFSPDQILARRLEEELDARRITSQSFAHGKAEAVEIEVTHRSPVRGRSLKELRPRSWIVGTILRGDELLIPHGDTIFEEGDLVTILGAGASFAEIVRTFASGEARFPLDYGKNIVLAAEPKELEAIEEAASLVRNSRASALLLVHRDPTAVRDEDEVRRLKRQLDEAAERSGGIEVARRAVRDHPRRALPQVAAEESAGVLVLRSRHRGGIRSLWAADRAAALVKRTARPVLLARGTHPYRRILVPSRATAAGHAAARAAIDLAVKGKASLHALAAVDPVFLVGPEAAQEARGALAWMREEAAVLGLSLEGRIERGNPVRLFLEAVRNADLLVLGVSRHSASRFPFSVVVHLAGRAPVSVLLVPAGD